MPDIDDEVALISKISKLDLQIRSSCNLIPIQAWGFDEDVHEKLKERKHRMVNQVLSKKEKQRYSKDEKNYFARCIGGSCSTVSDVFDWMSTSSMKNVQPRKAELNVQKSTSHVNNDKESVNKEKKKTAVKEVNKEKKVKPTHPESSSDSEDDDDDVVEAPSSASPAKKQQKQKPVAAVKPTVREPVEEEIMDVDNVVDGSGDSTDEEVKPDSKPKNKRKPTDDGNIPKKKGKLDQEIEKLESVDPATLDPIESRKIALLKLQKKLGEMKSQRTGKKDQAKSAAEAENARKLKRRLSKMQMKQRRALEKQQKQAAKEGKGCSERSETSLKKEAKSESNLPKDDAGNVVYSKFDFIIKDTDSSHKLKRLPRKERFEKFTGKDYKALLTRVEKRDEKLKKLQEKEPEKAKIMEDDIKWNRALKKAQGIKVKDNAELLKKGLKNKEKAKEKRLSKWKSRESKVQQDKDKKQQRRMSNIQKRVDDKKKKRMQKLREKGRIL